MNVKASSTAEQNSTSSVSNEAQLNRVREVLLEPQAARIAELEAELHALRNDVEDEDTRTQSTSEVLATAVKRSHKQDDKLSDALKPIVVDQFREVSRTDPEMMAEALFPILGPAVRKMIVNIITPDKKNKKRQYRLEQLFLIDKNTGLPICHVASESVHTQDADMVSGMLSAIQSFVQDAFETNEFDGLDTLQLGELSVWIEWGPQGVLAGVVRGTPPKSLRDAMQILIESIHRRYNQELVDYGGDNSAFEELKPELMLFLDSHDGSFINRLKNMSTKAKQNSIIAVAALAIAILLFINGRVQDARWAEFIQVLDASPGIVVTGFREEGRLYKVFGLRDPLAVDPGEVLKASDTKRKVRFELEPYQALLPEFVVTRLTSALSPPSTVKISVEGGSVVISGSADKQWVQQAQAIAKPLQGAQAVLFNVNQVD